LAYQRGNGSVEVELSRTQSWIEGTDPVLWGRNGEVGLIQEHRDAMNERKRHDESVSRRVTLMGIFGGAPCILELLRLFHVIK
jgi:hypothetical protein